MNVELFCVTFSRDFQYLEWCIKSVRKFCTGFSQFTIMLPTHHVDSFHKELGQLSAGIPIRVIGFQEWLGKGMMHHMALIMHADEHCPEADFIVHIDADCIFTAPVTPETYIRNGKPILRFEYFTRIAKRHTGAELWQAPTQACLPFKVDKETMRCHPGVYHRGLYAKARALVEAKIGGNIDDYIRTREQGFPQGFCEFVTLGNVALHEFPQQYHGVEQFNDCVQPDNLLQQFWSHGPIDKPQKIWIRGKQTEVVPIQMINRVLGA